MQAGLEAHVVLDGAVFEAEGDAGDAREEAADGECGRDHAVGVDAHELRGVGVLGGGLHGASGAGEPDEEGQGRHAEGATMMRKKSPLWMRMSPRWKGPNGSWGKTRADLALGNQLKTACCRASESPMAVMRGPGWVRRAVVDRRTVRLPRR